MLIDLDALDEDATIEAQVGIIGGGAAGIAMALELIGGGDVALIESGGLEYDAETQALYEGEVKGLPYFPLDSARLRYLGGSTNHWGGQSVPLQPIDFMAREWVPESGWPIGYGEFARYLPRAELFCRLTVVEAGQSVWEPGPEMPEFPLVDTGFQPVLLRFPKPAFSFGSIYRRAIERAEGLTCFLHANAIGIETDPTRRRVSAVRLGSLDGRRATLRAETYVLATGGIENCRLLLASGLGNEHGLVGRYFMEHPNYDTGLVQLAETPYLSNPFQMVGSQSVRFDAQLSPEHQAQLRILNHSVYLRRQRMRRGRIHRLWDRLAERVTGPGDDDFWLHIRLEHAPDPESRITLIDEVDAFGMPRAALTLRVGDLEARTIEHLCDAFARAIGMADLGRMRADFSSSADWQADLGWQYHNCGGTRMSADPAKGVVDTDCRVHGVDNLYIAGSSIFPTCGHANPTMNLLAFTVRLADHIKTMVTR